MVQTYWTMAVRRKWLILGSVLFALAVAGMLCKVLPKVYRSSTLISVERQKIPTGYVGDIVGGSLNERLTLIKQQLLSRTRLEKVIAEFKPEVGNWGEPGPPGPATLER